MFKLPLPDIIQKIKIGSGISDEDINQKIDVKMQQLSGLISKEGAAHIVANELGIKLFEQTSGILKIKNIRPRVYRAIAINLQPVIVNLLSVRTRYDP